MLWRKRTGYRGIAIVGLDHVQLAIPPGGEDLARAFYGGVLGMVELTKPEDLARKGGCWFQAAGVQVHLGVEQGFRPARKAHPALLVDDLAGMATKLNENGFGFAKGAPISGYDRVDTHDPFGNRIELMQRLEEC